MCVLVYTWFQLLRYIISQVTTLWELCMNKNAVDSVECLGEDPLHTWRPWEHIYSLCKVAKHHVPLYNPHGKYIVRLYWMVSHSIMMMIIMKSVNTFLAPYFGISPTGSCCLAVLSKPDVCSWSAYLCQAFVAWPCHLNLTLLPGHVT